MMNAKCGSGASIKPDFFVLLSVPGQDESSNKTSIHTSSGSSIVCFCCFGFCDARLLPTEQERHILNFGCRLAAPSGCTNLRLQPMARNAHPKKTLKMMKRERDMAVVAVMIKMTLPRSSWSPWACPKIRGNRFVAVTWDRELDTKGRDALDLHYDRIELTEDHVMFCRKANLCHETFNANSVVDELWSLPM